MSLPMISKVETNDILLRAESGSIFVVRFAGAPATPSLYVLDPKVRPEDLAQNAFNSGMILGVPKANGKHPADDTFRLDMAYANGNVQKWLAARDASHGQASSLDPAQDASTAGPYDVVFGRNDHGVRRVYVVKSTTYKGPVTEPGDPQSVVEATDPASVEAVQSLFDTGVLLAYLQELTLPIGFTCYLLNTEKFWK